MRVILLLLGLTVVLAWLGWEFRHRDRAVSNVCFVFSALVALLFLALFEGWI